jgi:hypothetical protein
LARAKFKAKWEDKRAKIERELLDLSQKEDRSKADREREQELSKDRRELRSEQSKEEGKLALGAWRDLQRAVTYASARNNIRSYWRQVVFVLGTLLTAFGLMIVSSTAEGAERWVCLVGLAILAVSIYIGGIAWLPLPIG